MKKKIIFLTGPTGVGKTDLSFRLCDEFPFEIISMDSMQVYQKMDIGTAKATKEEQAKYCHHLLDICHPKDNFSVVDYTNLAKRKIDEIYARGKIPLFVGGTGLYMNSLRYGYSYKTGMGNKKLREKLEEDFDKDGGKKLFHQLKKIDPITYDKLHLSDKKRIIRALEVYYEKGEPFSSLQNDQKEDGDYHCLVFVLSRQRKILYERINQRVDAMLEDGLIEEVLHLRNRGLNRKDQAMEAIGYKEVLWYLEGFVTFEEMSRLLKRNSRHYAKRQETWFRKDPNNIWLDAENLPIENIINKIKEFLYE